LGCDYIEQIKYLHLKAIQLEKKLLTPLEIEWAICDDDLILLQIRPIIVSVL